MIRIKKNDLSMNSTANESTICTRRINFTEDFDNCDTKIIVAGETLYAHKLILSMSSPVFKAMLNSDFKEGVSNVIELPGKETEDVINLLTQIYPFPEPISEEYDIEALLSLLREYQIDLVDDRIQEFLSKKAVMSVDMLLLSQEFELPSLAQETSSKLSKQDYTKLREHPKFGKIRKRHLVPLMHAHIENLHAQMKTMHNTHAVSSRNIRTAAQEATATLNKLSAMCSNDNLLKCDIKCYRNGDQCSVCYFKQTMQGHCKDITAKLAPYQRGCSSKIKFEFDNISPTPKPGP